MYRRWLSICILPLFIVSGVARADEGMWLFNNLPLKTLKSKYGVEPDDKWVEHLMKSCVRFNIGGSASFISKNGLVLTNHHVGSDTLAKLSTEKRNILVDGFYAKSLADELKAPDLELNQLISVEDVTAQVKGAVKEGMSGGEAAAARRAIMSKLEKLSTDKTGLRSDVVALYGGGRYQLYRYKKFTDVRLVWAPESAIAFFGGDADNFEYPRFCLDACIFRVYEDGKPAKIKHYLKWSKSGAKENEPIFVAGNPGRTQRIFTVAALKHQRDYRVPYVLDFIRRREILLNLFGQRSEENKRIAKEQLLGIQNSRKAYLGMIRGLQDPSFIKLKEQQESSLLAKIKADPALKKYAPAWDKIAEIQKKRAAIQGKGISLNTRIFNIAQTLVQMADEDLKPNEQRLRDYVDSFRSSLELQLFSKAPIHKDLERVVLADLISRAMELRGAEDELIVKILDGKSPMDRAAELVNGTKVDNVEFRKELAKGGKKVIDASKDPMILLAKLVDGEFRANQKTLDEINEAEQQAYGQISEALFATQGTSTYPDATFTLRLAFGVVKGYEENGKKIPAWTTMGGTYDHEKSHNAKTPWKLPESWVKNKGNIDGSIPFNFVSTADIIGGNSGSPVVNKDLELVGLIFDGNIQSLTGNYFYSEKQSRATSVHSSAIREALEKIYKADRIIQEISQ